MKKTVIPGLILASISLVGFFGYQKAIDWSTEQAEADELRTKAIIEQSR